MYRVSLLSLIYVVVSAGRVWGETIPPAPVEGKIAWVYSYSEGQELAAKNGKPLFVVFRCER